MMIREKLEAGITFSDVESAIADYILKKGDAIKNESGRHIASAVYTSPSSVVRLCQKLGFCGYNDFREEWLKELDYLKSHFQEMDPNRPFAPGDSAGVIANKLGALYSETIYDTLALLDEQMLKQAIKYCIQAENIYVFSAGAQLQIADAFCDKMAKIGKNVILCGRGDVAYYHANFCRENDCFIIISYSGETPQVLRPALKVKEREIPAIAITSSGSNSLSNMFTCNLFVSTRERLVDQLGSFGAHLTSLFVLDVIYAGVFNHDFEGNLERKNSSSRKFEQYRKSSNSMIKDDEII